MDLKTIARQMMQFHEAAFDNTFDAMTVMQQQAEKMIAAWVSRNPLITAEGERAISGWLTAYSKSREDFKATVDDNYRKVERVFVDYEWTPPPRVADTPAAAKITPSGKAEGQPASVKARSPRKAVRKTTPAQKAVPKKKAAPAQKAVPKKKAAPVQKAVPKKKPVPAKKKAAVKKNTNIDAVTGLIRASTEGISTTELKEKTGLTERQIWNIVNNAVKEGKISKIKRGVYCAADVEVQGEPRKTMKAVPKREIKPEPKKGAIAQPVAEPKTEPTKQETLAVQEEPSGAPGKPADSAASEPRGQG